MNLRLNYKILIINAIFLVVCLLFCLFFILPVLNSVKVDSKALLESKKELYSLETKIDQIENFKKTYDEAEYISKRIDGMLVDSRVPVDLINFWENLAKNNNLSIEISQTSLSASDIGLPSIGFQLALVGNFSDFSRFLEQTESAPYLIEEEFLSIQKVKGEIAKSEKSKNVSISSVRALLSVSVYSK